MTKQKTQTTPKGQEIPIPKSSDFFRNLKKATTPVRSRKRPERVVFQTLLANRRVGCNATP